MFTGLIEEVGTIVGRVDLPEATQLTIEGPLVSADLKAGDSIAVDGVCLTAVRVHDQLRFTTDVMLETLDRTTFHKVEQGRPVNLERAVQPVGRLGGHIVQGHVDGTAALVARHVTATWHEYCFRLPDELARYVAVKGSIAVDGVSLTVSDLDRTKEGWQFQVGLIPTTLSHTTLGGLAVGDATNVEVDVIAKYLARLVPESTSSERGE